MGVFQGNGLFQDGVFQDAETPDKVFQGVGVFQPVVFQDAIAATQFDSGTASLVGGSSGTEDLVETGSQGLTGAGSGGEALFEGGTASLEGSGVGVGEGAQSGTASGILGASGTYRIIGAEKQPLPFVLPRRRKRQLTIRAAGIARLRGEAEGNELLRADGRVEARLDIEAHERITESGEHRSVAGASGTAVALDTGSAALWGEFDGTARLKASGERGLIGAAEGSSRMIWTHEADDEALLLLGV